MNDFNQLAAICFGKHIYIQTHNFPDPDAIASVFGLQRLLSLRGIPSTLCYDGKIDKLSASKMLEAFQIKIFPYEQLRPNMTEEDYEAGGSTALLDAIGSTISAISRRQKRMEGRPDHTIFVIITDGEENSSREYSHQQIRKMIQRKRKDKDWEFIFLGANIDAEETADGLGMDSEMAVNYHADSRGTQLNFEAVGTALRSLRTTGGITGRWRKDIDMDFKDR